MRLYPLPRNCSAPGSKLPNDCATPWLSPTFLMTVLPWLCLWVLLWHSKRHLFHNRLLAAVVECGRADMMNFSCVFDFFLPFVLLYGKYFSSPGLDGRQLCLGGGVSGPGSSSISCGCSAALESQAWQGSRAHRPGLPWSWLLLSTVTEALPLNQAPLVLKGSENLRPHCLQREKLFFPCRLPEVVFSQPNEDI